MLRLHQSPLRLENMQGSQKHASKGNSSKDIGISIVIPSFSRFATLQRVLVRLLLSSVVRQLGSQSEIVIAHCSAESIAGISSLLARTRALCDTAPSLRQDRTTCDVSKIVHVDVVALNSAIGCASRYFAAAAARFDLIVHVDDDLLPTSSALSTLVHVVASRMRRTPFVLAGGVRRSCGARGYGGAVTQPHAVDTYLSNEESIEAVHSGAEENEARNSDVIVLTSFAATTWEMNRMFLLDFDQLYRAMMISTHGNGCDLIYTDYLRRNGGIVHDLPRNATKFGFVSQESQQEGGYKDKPEHYVARSKICRCLANKDTSPGCAQNRLPS